ncbi:MAG: glutamyl-tRNA reductase [Xanthomonadales bacterium]|nr:glutamyl-tRNA reductase [Xanthomonadales bacterium]
MQLLAAGLNHNTAPVGLREQISIGPDETLYALRDLKSCAGVEEAAILSTCNRTELYCRVDQAASTKPIDWLHEYRSLDNGRLEPFIYRHQQADAVRHVLRVASGLDSMILGEPEILGQMKSAYQLAREAASLDAVLERLFQHSFATAKQVRTDTAIGREPVSVAFAAVTLARRLFGTFHNKTVLLIGAGETIELAARHLCADRGVDHLIVANRSDGRAQELARRFVGTAVSLDALPDQLGKADLIFSSTGAQERIVTLDMMQTALKGRRRKPVFIVDLAVPRDFDEAIAELEDIYLYTVDDLKDVVEAGERHRQAAADQASDLIDLQVTQYMRWLKAQSALSLIRDFRREADATREDVLQKARNDLAAGKAAEQVVEQLAHRLTQRLLHPTSSSLRAAGEAGRSDLLEAAREILKLPKE